MIHHRSAWIVLPAVLLLAGCSQTRSKPAVEAATTAKPAAAPEPVSAKAAFSSMYKAAYGWTPDATLIRVTARELPGYQNREGRAAMWEAVFASPSQHKYRVYTYAIAAVPPDIYRGLEASPEMPWGGISRDAMPIDLSMFQVDSSAAYTAAAAAAAGWLKTHPSVKLTDLEIGSTFRFQVPVWYVRWGDRKNGYAAFVDANSGRVLKRR